MTLRLDATPEELRLFLAETQELLDTLDEQLLRLEHAGSDPSLLQEVFRAAHTIKGNSAAIGHTRMAALTHAMETVLDRLRHGELAATSALVDRLLEATDVLKVLATEVETLEQSDVDVDSQIRALESWADTPQAATGPAVRPTQLTCPPGATHHLVLEFEAGPWAPVRALQALMELEAVAEVLATHPSRAEIEQQRIDRRLEAWVSIPQAPAAVHEVLAQVPEVTVLSLLPAEEALAAQAAEARDGALDERADEARATAPVASGRASTTTVRIDVTRLDTLLNLVGELVIDRTRLLELGRVLADQVGESRVLSELYETTQHLGRVTDELQAEVMKSRMLPIATVFSRFPRLVRDLATRQGKRVELVIEGQETELDRSVIEEIGDPLVHLLRNAIDHGVEPPGEREAAGKPPVARVRLAAEHTESSIVIVVEDDGRGIDPARVRARAIERGVLSPEAAARLTDTEAVDLIFAPGFSTAQEVSDVSGRGVGMDIVRTNVERVGGTVEVQTTVGAGTRFVLRLPLTLAIVHALLVRVGAGVYAIPLSSVTETLRVPASDVQRLQRQEAILLRGRVLPLVRLAAVFGTRPGEARAAEPTAPPAAEDGADDMLLVVAVRLGERQVGLVVDRLLGDQEVVIKALGPLVGDVPGVSSAAILGDGTVALIVEVAGLIQRLASERPAWRWSDGSAAGSSALPVAS
ncbi:MAG TPA: chemotaxis protein CheA [Chloroflexota bacterium]|nr:chemotaxis protein CheA [Chloroflexota bacterium]